MDPLEKAIDGLEQTLAAHLEYVLGTAVECPPSGSTDWDRLCSVYGVRPRTGPDRAARVALHRGARGALPEEVRPLLDAVVIRARKTLVLLEETWGSLLETNAAHRARLDELRDRLDGLVDEKLDEYGRRIHAPPVGTVGSIFANVTATAKMVPWADQKWKRAMPLVCTKCGAPQTTPLDFVCVYCGSPLGGRED